MLLSEFKKLACLPISPVKKTSAGKNNFTKVFAMDLKIIFLSD